MCRNSIRIRDYGGDEERRLMAERNGLYTYIKVLGACNDRWHIYNWVKLLREVNETREWVLIFIITSNMIHSWSYLYVRQRPHLRWLI